VSATLKLDHPLGWEVTAEDVETAEQLARLRELDRDMAQGYHLWEPSISTPVSAFLERIIYMGRTGSPISEEGALWKGRACSRRLSG
jgi:sensor c-di-GMP phosphodiesterase-like protein